MILSLRRREGRKIALAEAQRRGGKDLAHKGDGVEGASKNEDSSTELTQLSRKKTIFRGALELLALISVSLTGLREFQQEAPGGYDIDGCGID